MMQLHGLCRLWVGLRHTEAQVQAAARYWPYAEQYKLDTVAVSTRCVRQIRTGGATLGRDCQLQLHKGLFLGLVLIGNH